jgi:phage terminase Nu1 subunit (DNA packaging protein)
VIDQTMNGTQFAELCGVSPDTVSRWCRNGMPHQGGGRSGMNLEIDVRRALPWLAEVQRPDSAHEQLAHERANKFALENEETRRSLVKREHVAEGVDRLQKLLAKRLKVPQRLANQIAATSDPALIRSLLQEHIRKVREQYANDVERLGS